MVMALGRPPGTESFQPIIQILNWEIGEPLHRATIPLQLEKLAKPGDELILAPGGNSYQLGRRFYNVGDSAYTQQVVQLVSILAVSCLGGLVAARMKVEPTDR